MTKPACSVDGCERAAIARGWCPSHYGRWREHGDPLKGAFHKSPSDLPDSIVSLYVNELWSTPQLAKHFECSIYTVAKRLRELNVAFRPAGNSKGSRYKNPQRHFISREQLTELYVNQKLSADAVGEQFGCSMPTVLVRLRECDIEIRGFGEHRKGQAPHNFDPTVPPEARVSRRTIPGLNQWRLSVYRRDNYACVKCHKRGGTIHAHHLASYLSNPELRCELSNGVTLCRSCHLGFHRVYGQVANTAAQFAEFLIAERVAA